MFVITRGNTDNQASHLVLFFAEAYAFRVLAEDDAGFQNAIFGFDSAVRDRDGLTQIGGVSFSRSSIAWTYSGST
ncbi:Uncharacterised protein [Klebsiella michiganensis]|nr:Uncharacterised protein [Klebsiella michiganensis]